MNAIIRNGTVVNVYNGVKPAGYQPTSDIWIPLEGENAGAWVGWRYVAEDQPLVAPEPVDPPADDVTSE